jgi:Protein of unknown function (DUF3592)
MSQAFKSDITRATIWTNARWVAPIAVLAGVWALSIMLHIFDGMPLVGEDFTAFQAFVFSGGMFWPVAACFYANSECGLANTRLSRGWPTTPGTVLSSEIFKKHLFRWGTFYRLDVTYEYAVSGVPYVGDRVSFGSQRVLDEDFITSLAEKYRERAGVMVHFDPDDPATSVLEVSSESAAAYAIHDRQRAGVFALLPIVFFGGVGLRAIFQ